MKRIVFISLLLVAVTKATVSQPIINELPAATGIIHYKLAVGYNTTTVLIFPAPVKQADRGYRDLIAQKQPGVENVLKIKAARKDFTPTNLHVFTSDGRIYAFDVSYTPDPLRTTYDLTKLDTGNANARQRDIIEFSVKAIDKAQIIINAGKVKNAKSFFSTSTHKYRMKWQLQTIYRSDDILLLGFTIANRSNLPYNIDFTRLYIRDNQKIKRSSVQEREVIPLYTDTVSTIPGNATVKWVVAVPKMTIPDHRKFVLEMYEKNGGRHLVLEVTNRQLFKAKNLE